jgi:DMSO/TMAO reductase YedYZ molybdopterin-dependent catalytic subunit
LRRWDWKSFRDLPSEIISADLHCVKRWSKLGTSWEGVSLDTILADVKTDASYALARSYGDYTTNLPLNDLRNKQAWIAFRFDGKRSCPGTRRASTASRPSPLFVEERQVGSGHHADAAR